MMISRFPRAILVAALLLFGWAAHSRAQDAARRPVYTSHYLVFGTQDASGTPRILAVDLNRTGRGPDRVDYEYKLFVARGGDWSMPVYETWTVDPDTASRFPSRSGLVPTITDDGPVTVEVDRPGLSLRVTSAPSAFPFPTENAGAARTAHPSFTVEWNDATYEGSGVYEWIQSDRGGDAAEEEGENEAARQLDEEATFGLYDWIVLYDDEGRLWHVSQGTLTDDFAYQAATDALPAETRDVLVRWTATEYDEMGRQHRPTTWLVDVPDWGMRVKLQKRGEHRGHGEQRDDGTRPIYVQASVEGRGIVRGDERRFFGMVEHIRD